MLYIDKNFVYEGKERYFKIELYFFTKNFFRKTLVQYATVWLVRIWTHKNADEKGHTFSKRSKNVKKRTKTYEKRILCKFTLTIGRSALFLLQWLFRGWRNPHLHRSFHDPMLLWIFSNSSPLRLLLVRSH